MFIQCHEAHGKLFDSGDFYRSLEVIAGKNNAVIRTVISYSVFLVSKYADILGLDEESWTKFLAEYTIPTIKKNFDDIIAKS